MYPVGRDRCPSEVPLVDLNFEAFERWGDPQIATDYTLLSLSPVPGLYAPPLSTSLMDVQGLHYGLECSCAASLNLVR